MGLVYEAEDANLLRTVALKVIRPELSSTPQAARRFLLEARAMAALKHDHIATIYQVSRHRGVPFLVMEYLRGISLDRWLDQGHEPTVDQVLRLGREVAAGLDAAHGQGVIHRDIKPANIWLEAPAGTVKILDFGLARTAAQDVRITSPGTTVGSPAYLAPELARGARGTPSCDLFSLGCVLYRLCTRKLPFDGTTLIAVLTSLATETPPFPRTINPDVPPALEDLVMRLLSRNPADRPESAQTVVEAIRVIERGRRSEASGSVASPLPQPPELGGASGRRAVDVANAAEASVDSATSRRVRRSLVAAAVFVSLGASVITIALSVHRQPRGALSPARVVSKPGPVSAPGDGRAAARPGPAPKVSVLAPAAAVATSPGPAPVVANSARDKALLKAVPVPDPPRRQAVVEKAAAGPTVVPGVPTMPGRARLIEAFGDRSRIIDPDGDCLVSRDEGNGRASILIPGTAHLLSTEIDRMNAPRLVREVTGDFEVRVRVLGIDAPGSRATSSRFAPYHGAGLVLWKNSGHYVRLEIAADHRKSGSYPYANFELRRDGRLATSWGIKIPDRSTYLRIVRTGDEVRAAFSPDAVNWTPFAAMDAGLPDRVEVGVLAVNASAKPLKAEFEQFQLIAVPEAGTKSRYDADPPSLSRPSPGSATQVPAAPEPAPPESARSSTLQDRRAHHRE